MNGTLPDVLDYGLAVVFCGINPGAKAAAAGHNFAGHSNRFWRAVHLAGFTPALIAAEQDLSFLRYGCGLTAAVARATRRAQDLSRSELTGAGDALRTKIERYHPKTVAFLGKAAYSAITARREIAWGDQAEAFGGARVWILPNPSGLNRNYSLAQLVDAYKALRIATTADFEAFGAVHSVRMTAPER